MKKATTRTATNRYPVLPSLVLALAFSVQCLNAAENTPATAPSKNGNQTAPGNTSTAAPLDKKSQARLKRAHHLAEKTANNEFLNSPQGIAFKKQIASVDQEINAVYEKYLNIFLEGQDKGKKLRAERDRQLQALHQKKAKLEDDYEKLKTTSPECRAMVEKHLQSQLHQLRGKLKSQPSEDEDNQ